MNPDSPWGATIERWQREGMPTDVSWADYFGLDRFAGIGVDNSPRYPARTIEETDEYAIVTTAWGATLRNFKHAASVPEFLDFKITGPGPWREAKARMTPSRDRISPLFGEHQLQVRIDPRRVSRRARPLPSLARGGSLG